MNYMTREDWTMPPSFTENVKPCGGSKTLSFRDGNISVKLSLCHCLRSFCSICAFPKM